MKKNFSILILILIIKYLFILNVLFVFYSDECNHIKWIFWNQKILLVYDTGLGKKNDNVELEKKEVLYLKLYLFSNYLRRNLNISNSYFFAKTMSSANDMVRVNQRSTTSSSDIFSIFSINFQPRKPRHSFLYLR